MKAIIYILTLFFSFALLGQKTKYFEDRFGVQGTITYSGSWSDTLLPEKGKYSLKWRDIIDDTLTSFASTGSLKSHLPHGFWTWEEAGWDYTVETGRTIVPDFKAKGLHAFWQGGFSNGLPNGNWLYGFGEPIVNPKSKKTPLRISTVFNNGLFNGKFEVHDNTNEDLPVKITGFCNKEGVAEGKWIFEFKDYDGKLVEEIRVYNQGVLLKIITNSKSKSDTLDFYMTAQKMSLISEDNNQVIIGEQKFSYDGEWSESQELYKHYIHEHFLCGWSHLAFPYKVRRIAPIFKRLAFPLSEEEIQTRENIEKEIDVLDSIIKEKLNLGNVTINRNRSEELDLAISTLEQAQKRIIVIKDFVTHSYAPEFIYNDRKHGGLKNWLMKINETARVKGVAYPESHYQLKTIQLKTDLFTVFESIYNVVEALKNETAIHIKQVEKSFKALSREGELKKLENKLSDDLVELDSLYKNKGGIGEHIREYWINNYFKKHLQIYAQTDDYEKAKGLSKSLLTKMDSLVSWSDQWSKIDSLELTLKESYINFAYNPYTGDHDIELPIKKRFIDNVLKTLIPWMKEQLIKAEEWEEFKANYRQIMTVRNYLIQFASKDNRQDRRVERRLRREDQPDKILKVFINHMED